MLAKLSVLGLYTFDPTIFDPMILPVSIDRETLVSSILTECAEIPTVYPSPESFKHIIAAWSARRADSWERILSALTAEYSPIENFDRREEYSDTHNTDTTTTATATAQHDATGNGNTTTTASGTSDTTTTDNRTDTTANTAFNSDDFKDATRTTTAANGTAGVVDSDTSETTTANTDHAEDASTTRGTGNTVETVQHSARLHGNIGVTTNQQMITAELALRVTDVYNEIVQDFMDMFCVRVY